MRFWGEILGIRDRLKQRRYDKGENQEEQSFTAFIIRGNRQVVQREVRASKRFLLDEETYIIRPECIFLKNIDGYLTSVSYYREGNPNPYSFDKENKGIDANQLDRIFAEDFFHIVTAMQLDTRRNYILVVAVVNMFLAVGLLMKVAIFS